MAAFSLSAFKIRLISSILKEVFSKNTPLDRAYADHFRKIKLESDEQALIIRLVNDLIRRLNYYTYIAGYKKVKDMKNHINALISAVRSCHLVSKLRLSTPKPEQGTSRRTQSALLCRRLITLELSICLVSML